MEEQEKTEEQQKMEILETDFKASDIAARVTKAILQLRINVKHDNELRQLREESKLVERLIYDLIGKYLELIFLADDHPQYHFIDTVARIIGMNSWNRNGIKVLENLEILMEQLEKLKEKENASSEQEEKRSDKSGAWWRNIGFGFGRNKR